MRDLWPWLGDLGAVSGLGGTAAGLISVLASVVCGTAIGLERERRDKPAGLRTLTLIALGSTIYTMLSLLLAGRKETADPARLAAQIIPGIGFLGAGAIIQARGTVHGLTTAAAIWTTAAIGVTIGSGHVAAGIGFTVAVLLTLRLLQGVEARLAGPCLYRRAVVAYRAASGKARPVLQEILDLHHVQDLEPPERDDTAGEQRLAIRVCVSHREHRSVLRELAERPEVVALELVEERAGPERDG